jgi:uncharacterized protein (TIGR04141 family)
MESLPLSVYLLKPSRKKVGDILKLPTRFEYQILTFEDGLRASLWLWESENQPEWLKFLHRFSGGAQEIPTQRTLSGILHTEVDSNGYLIAFGHGWQRIVQSEITPNFGIRCALNLSSSADLRAIRRDRIGDDFIQAIEQIPERDSIWRFGIDIYRDLLRGVKAEISTSTIIGAHKFGSIANGTDSFKANFSPIQDSIKSYLKRCYAAYSETAYKENFKWVDNIHPIRDELSIKKLNYQLLLQITGEPGGLLLSFPELTTWDGSEIISFERRKRNAAPVRNRMLLSEWIAYARSKHKRITMNTLFIEHLYGYHQAIAGPGEKWTIFECIHGIISWKENKYLLHGGEWFQIDVSYLQEIEKRIADVEISNLTLPKVEEGEIEPKYNDRIARASNNTIIKMDADVVYHGGGKSQIEVCDLLTDCSRLVCVKPWRGKSGSLSHLIQQAINTAKLIRNDETFREKVAHKLEGKFDGFYKLVWDDICSNNDTELVLAVLHGPNLTEMPLFAKLSVLGCIDMLRSLRFKPTFKSIDKAY